MGPEKETILLLLPALVLSACSDRDRTQGKMSMEKPPLSVIAAKDVPEMELRNAIRELGPVTEPAQFWVNIANDSAYGMVHRRYCIFQLFKRHVPPGSKLSELYPRLNGPKWLRDEDVAIFGTLGGKIPVKWTFEDTVFCLRVFPDLPGDVWAIYLRISGKIDCDVFIKLLRGERVDPQFRNAKVLEVGFNPPL
jgi:hypothetical protein